MDGIDILVNNAGIEHRASLEEHSAAIWEKVLLVNLTAPFKLAQAAAPYLAASGVGAIVNITSVAVTGYSGQIAYDVSKGGLQTLTRSLAVELGPRGIRANAVCPGFIQTPMVEAHADLKAVGTRFVRALPISRMGRPEEVAAAVLWLSSDAASYVTGQTIAVDGGWLRR
jgi:3-oxoacyl-[acyl-carrier protein] reductase